MPRRVITRFEMLSDRPEWLRQKGPVTPLYGPDLSPGQPFYHGSKALLQVGQIINPTSVGPFSNYWELKTQRLPKYAFATRDYSVAKDYAVGKPRNRPGYIYEVEPVSPDWSYNNGEYLSPSGWKVSGLIEKIPGQEQYWEDEEDL